MPSAAPEAVRSPRAFGEFFDHFERRLDDRNDNELRETLHRLQRVVVLAAIPTAHEQRSLIVGIDEADEVAEHDAVLVAESRARKDDRRQRGVIDVDRDTCRHELDLSGREH